MYTTCEACGLVIEREPGYFLGSIYFNYGVTALIVTAAYFAGHFLSDIPPPVLLWTLAGFCVAFPLWFFRYARSLWMGLDELVDAAGASDQARRDPEEDRHFTIRTKGPR